MNYEKSGWNWDTKIIAAYGLNSSAGSKFLKKTETSLHKRQSIWSTFKKAYLKSRNFEKFWNNLDKNNLPKDLVDQLCTYDGKTNSSQLIFYCWIE